MAHQKWVALTIFIGCFLLAIVQVRSQAGIYTNLNIGCSGLRESVRVTENAGYSMECAMACSAYEGCWAYQWIRNNECHLVLVDLPGLGTNETGTCEQFNLIVATKWSFVAGKHTLFDDIGPALSSSTPIACRKACLTYPTCLSIEFDPATANCYLNTNSLSSIEDHPSKNFYYKT